MSDIADFTRRIQSFDSKTFSSKVEIFGWYLHEFTGKAKFSPSDITRCFDNAHSAQPGNITSLMHQLVMKKPPRLLRDAQGYRLPTNVRDQIGQTLGRTSAASVSGLLSDLVPRISDPSQKIFLSETLICFNNKAYRAAIVMAWNMAFSDVIDRIVSNHLAAFNTGVGTHGLKKPITRREDFEDFNVKESVIIAIGRATGVIGKGTTKILEEKLDKRNTAAHPSSTVISAATAEEVIFDLVQNIILRPVL
ncbi:hypothetical protein [Delftia acidovorans]|uniref:hypothetical protein n=1 Tax=Delftia acidovorans TaxID=80866 RepID=UPI001C0DA167|nr:hypothetical protein [Delftia acidovorans]